MSFIQDLSDIIEKLRIIRDMGYILTHRSNDTGIGKTLEDLLEIPENNFRIPDIGVIELKAKRIDSNSMLTLATKSPEPKGINRVLFDHYKYHDDKGLYNLHSTCYGSRYNPQSFKVELSDNKLVLKNRDNIECYWPLSMLLEDVLTSKSDKTLLVFAETSGERKTINEKFHFIEAYLLSNLNKEKFKDAIEQDMLKVDIRIGVYRSGRNAGRYHDHGTGFRINKKHFLQLFDNYERVL
ncbi:hypothetical protein SDC9_07178 [bioreactor metagenome]|jgi:hypothetical protein|uniref:MvaI/BcnI restriction endonuclease domain-containing protein n=3 Tax=root TaxID=1 RepID=D2BJA3_DEHMV|nr:MULTISPECIES: MvaI/BcnI family restriction endonuclease [Dehalococcoides]ACZ62403.1 hypothetical protein DhcVS_1304 [Dehalococcoides mccartyi VS]AGG08454.1 hypothetical protein btf_1389 [Dehalococcoides mccartyi BTF08]AMU87166.1 MvaI-BcnI domain-containing protein [Dehalococcoides mccartyi]MBA2084372.1 hypothetical protein [Dehalococcoides mccartyi]POZ59471.1 TVG1488832 protein [Dehalococcoides mccartyi]